VTVPGPQLRPRRSRAARFALAGLLALPLVELVVAILVGRAIGAPATVMLLVLLSLAGLVVLRRGGAAAIRSLSTRAGVSRVPTGDDLRAAGDAGWLLLGGVLLVIPGFVTAVAGLLLVIPPTRRVLGPLLGRGAGLVVSHLVGAPLMGRVVGARVVQGNVVDATVVDVQVAEPTPPPVPPQLTDRPEDGHGSRPGNED
jgi:UPF0716 protein FxsA